MTEFGEMAPKPKRESFIKRALTRIKIARISLNLAFQTPDLSLHKLLDDEKNQMKQTGRLELATTPSMQNGQTTALKAITFIRKSSSFDDVVLQQLRLTSRVINSEMPIKFPANYDGVIKFSSLALSLHLTSHDELAGENSGVRPDSAPGNSDPDILIALSGQKAQFGGDPSIENVYPNITLS